MKIENIRGSKFNEKHGIPCLNNWDNVRNRFAFTVFSYALTPTGRVSKFWAAKTFWLYGKIMGKCIDGKYITERMVEVPKSLERRIMDWVENERPKLKRGYSWSNVFHY